MLIIYRYGNVHSSELRIHLHQIKANYKQMHGTMLLDEANTVTAYYTKEMLIAQH